MAPDTRGRANARPLGMPLRGESERGEAPLGVLGARKKRSFFRGRFDMGYRGRNPAPGQILLFGEGVIPEPVKHKPSNTNPNSSNPTCPVCSSSSSLKRSSTIKKTLYYSYKCNKCSYVFFEYRRNFR